MSGFFLSDLERIVEERAKASPDESWTAKLVASGQQKAAKKPGEEAIEAVMAAVTDDRDNLTYEAADVLYHLMVVLKIAEIPLENVMDRTCARGPRNPASRKRPAGRIHEHRDTDYRSERKSWITSRVHPFSPYHFFTSKQWAKFRADTPMTLTADEVKRLRSMGDLIDLDEVRRIYLSLSRLLSAHVESSQLLFEQRNRFLSLSDVTKTPFVIGIAGSVAVGKSTTARILKELLGPVAIQPQGRSRHDGRFPLSQRRAEAREPDAAQGFSGKLRLPARSCVPVGDQGRSADVQAPSYSHLFYDVLPDEYKIVDRPDILIVEGINVLQSRDLPADGKIVPMVSDFFDFSIYIDAEETQIHNWYVDALYAAQGNGPSGIRIPIFHRYAIDQR